MNSTVAPVGSTALYTIQVHPLAFHLDVSLIYPPGVVGRLEPGTALLFAEWSIAGPPAPAVYRGMVEAKPSPHYNLFQVSVTSVTSGTEGVPQMPPQAKQDDFGAQSGDT